MSVLVVMSRGACTARTFRSAVHSARRSLCSAALAPASAPAFSAVASRAVHHPHTRAAARGFFTTPSRSSDHSSHSHSPGAGHAFSAKQESDAIATIKAGLVAAGFAGVGGADSVSVVPSKQFAASLRHRTSFVISCFCRDELSVDVGDVLHALRAKEENHDHSRPHNSFELSSLGGLVTCGPTAYGAAAHHVPDFTSSRPNVVLVGGPHISFRVDSRGDPPPAGAVFAGFWGSLFREGIRREDAACGALRGYMLDLAKRVRARKGVSATIPAEPADATVILDPEQAELSNTVDSWIVGGMAAGVTRETTALNALFDALRAVDPDFEFNAGDETNPSATAQRRVQSRAMLLTTLQLSAAARRRLHRVGRSVYTKLNDEPPEHPKPSKVVRPVRVVPVLVAHWNYKIGENWATQTFVASSPNNESFLKPKQD